MIRLLPKRQMILSKKLYKLNIKIVNYSADPVVALLEQIHENSYAKYQYLRTKYENSVDENKKTIFRTGLLTLISALLLTGVIIDWLSSDFIEILSVIIAYTSVAISFYSFINGYNQNELQTIYNGILDYDQLSQRAINKLRFTFDYESDPPVEVFLDDDEYNREVDYANSLNEQYISLKRMYDRYVRTDEIVYISYISRSG